MPHRLIDNAAQIIDAMWRGAGSPDINTYEFHGVHVLTALPRHDAAKLICALLERQCNCSVKPHDCKDSLNSQIESGASELSHSARWGEVECRVFGEDKA